MVQANIDMGRPSTVPSSLGSRSLLLPQIHVEHPASRLGNPAKLRIEGSGKTGVNETKQPLTNCFDSKISVTKPVTRPSSEDGGRPVRVGKFDPIAVYRSYRTNLQNMDRPENQEVLETKPKPKVSGTNGERFAGHAVVRGSADKTKIPIFGTRAQMDSRRENLTSRAGNLSSVSNPRLHIDELEILLREKVKHAYFELRKRFKDNDPDGKGTVDRKALARVVTSLLQRPLSQTQFTVLMERLGIPSTLRNIDAKQFYSCFQEKHFMDVQYPDWMDTVRRFHDDNSKLTKDEIVVAVRRIVISGQLDLNVWLPQTEHVLKTELRSALTRLNIHTSDVEFEKLWEAIDNNSPISLPSRKIQDYFAVHDKSVGSGTRELLPKEVDRQQSLNIEEWLKDRFRSGINEMKSHFKLNDPENSGEISADCFLRILSKFGLNLRKKYLEDFLARNGIDLQNPDKIPYRNFLHKFQDRSEDGIVHRILCDPGHRFNNKPLGQDDAKSALSAVEARLVGMFQNDFLSLLATFQRLDRLGKDVVSQEEFRAALESRFSIEISKAEFADLIDKAPLDDEGNVLYIEFLGQFDASGIQAESLWNSLLGKDANEKRELVPKFSQSPRMQRTPTELHGLLRDIVKQRINDLESSFYELDIRNTKRLDQESLYQLLRIVAKDHNITRGEIRQLWRGLIKNQDNTLDYQQFVRHFARSAVRNGIRQPVLGDDDMRMRSRKLNADTNILEDQLRAKVEYLWEDLLKEFKIIDEKNAGHVSEEEFVTVLSEFCVHLNSYELQALANRFRTEEDRICYMDFLKPFSLRGFHWRHGNDQDFLAHPGPRTLDIFSSRDKRKLISKWKVLRRAFKKMDTGKNGSLSVPDFRSVLKLVNVTLGEDEMYNIMTEYDNNLTGSVPYDRFLSDVSPQARKYYLNY